MKWWITVLEYSQSGTSVLCHHLLGAEIVMKSSIFLWLVQFSTWSLVTCHEKNTSSETQSYPLWALPGDKRQI